jgi:hypothetical protein
MRVLAAILAGALATAGCNALLGGSASPSMPSLPPDITIPPSMSLPPELGAVPPELFIRAAEETAAVANVPLDQVSLVRAGQVTWPDGSLGCPEPDQFYTQALVPGYWLVLAVGEREFDFRASQAGELRLCPEGQGQPPLNDR